MNKDRDDRVKQRAGSSKDFFSPFSSAVASAEGEGRKPTERQSLLCAVGEFCELDDKTNGRRVTWVPTK